jgi:hypothetical protein
VSFVAAPIAEATSAAPAPDVSTCWNEDIPVGYGAPQCNMRFASYSDKFISRTGYTLEKCTVMADKQPACVAITFVPETGTCFLIKASPGSDTAAMKPNFEGQSTMIRCRTLAVFVICVARGEAVIHYCRQDNGHLHYTSLGGYHFQTLLMWIFSSPFPSPWYDLTHHRSHLLL